MTLIRVFSREMTLIRVFSREMTLIRVFSREMTLIRVFSREMTLIRVLTLIRITRLPGHDADSRVISWEKMLLISSHFPGIHVLSREKLVTQAFKFS